MFLAAQTQRLMQGFVRAVAALWLLPPDALLQQTPMMEPLPRSLSEWKRRRSIDALLGSVWKRNDGYPSAREPSSPMLLEKKERESNDTLQIDFAVTYGEITPVGARQLWSAMGMAEGYTTTTSSSAAGEPPMVFADLGSGTGKLCVQATLELSSVDHVVGIELDPDRHATAIQRWATVQTRVKAAGQTNSGDGINQPKESLKLVQGDLFEMDLSNLTHVYVSSLCFDDDMLDRLATKLFSATNIRVVASLKPLPMAGVNNYYQQEVVYLEMTWTKPFGCPTYLYHRIR